MFDARHEVLPELFAPDYALDMREIAVEVGVVRGVEASQAALRGYAEAFDEFHTGFEEVIHVDERRVVTAVRNHGRMKGTASEVWNRFFHVWTFEERKVVRLSVHSDRTRALEAAGLEE